MYKLLLFLKLNKHLMDFHKYITVIFVKYGDGK